jgi:hypothetical protein
MVPHTEIFRNKDTGLIAVLSNKQREDRTPRYGLWPDKATLS